MCFHRSGLLVVSTPYIGMDTVKAAYYINNCAGRGKGVFSSRRFIPGEFILQFRGEQVHFRDIPDFTHYIQISPDYFLGPSGEADDFVNHSCEPNSAVSLEQGNLVLRALRNIGKGREIVFDYGTILFSEPTSFQCDCGSKQCRGIIGNFYTLPSDLQCFYLERNMVPLLTYKTACGIPAQMAEVSLA